jgi:hypothetical protein
MEGGLTDTMVNLRAALRRLPLLPQAYALLRLARGRNARFAADYSRNSGVGSNLEATRAVSAALPGVLDSLSVRSMLDIPCGDFLWMQHVDLGRVNYTGADIIEPLIESHQILYGSEQRAFRTLDIVTSDLPKVDVIFCRDCLVHLSEKLVKRAVNNIKRSGSEYLLTTTFPAHSSNKGIVTGSWRPINLCAPPFNFPEPILVLDDKYFPPYDDKSLGLWRVEDLPIF